MFVCSVPYPVGALQAPHILRRPSSLVVPFPSSLCACLQTTRQSTPQTKIWKVTTVQHQQVETSEDRDREQGQEHRPKRRSTNMYMRFHASLLVVVLVASIATSPFMVTPANGFSSPDSNKPSGGSHNGSNGSGSKSSASPSSKNGSFLGDGSSRGANRPYTNQLASSQMAAPPSARAQQAGSDRSKRKRKRVAGAPLVDSALLRFISEQKKQQFEQSQPEQAQDLQQIERSTSYPYNTQPDEDTGGVEKADAGVFANGEQADVGAERSQNENAIGNADEDTIADIKIQQRQQRQQQLSSAPETIDAGRGAVNGAYDGAVARVVNGAVDDMVNEANPVDGAVSSGGAADAGEQNSIATQLASAQSPTEDETASSATAADTVTTSSSGGSGRSTSSPTNPDVFDPWMGQYNRNRIAQKLMSLDVDEKTADLAGERVQSLFLARTARRRVREFLRKRDLMWLRARNAPVDGAETETGNFPTSFDTNGSIDGGVGSDSNAQAAAAMPSTNDGSNISANTNSIQVDDTPHPDYTFDDIIDVMLEYGLTGKDIGTILTHSPSLAMMMPKRSFAMRDHADTPSQQSANADFVDEVMQQQLPVTVGDDSGETLEETLQRSLRGLLMKELKLRKYDARKILRSCPGLLSMKGSKSAAQVVAMMTKIGVSAKSIARDKAALPALLSRSPAAIFRLVAFLSSDAVRMPTKQIGPLIRRRHSQALLDAVAPIPRIKALEQNTQNAAVSPNVVDAALQQEQNNGRSSPMAALDASRTATYEWREHANRVFRNMTATAWTLRTEIGTKDLSKVISAFPSVLLLDAHREILPVASFLMDELGIMEGDLPRVLQLYPMLLGKDIEDMRSIVAYLKSYGIDDETLASMFRAFPAVLSMDIEKDMIPVVQYLESIGITDVGRVIARLPPILGYSVEKDLKPKWEYLRRVCVYADDQIMRFPGYFSYPLERVIKARYEYLSSHGYLTDLIPIDTVVRHGDVEFAGRVARDRDGGEEFRDFLELRKERYDAYMRHQRQKQNQRNRGRNQPPPRRRRPVQQRTESKANANASQQQGCE